MCQCFLVLCRLCRVVVVVCLLLCELNCTDLNRSVCCSHCCCVLYPHASRHFWLAPCPVQWATRIGATGELQQQGSRAGCPRLMACMRCKCILLALFVGMPSHPSVAVTSLSLASFLLLQLQCTGQQQGMAVGSLPGLAAAAPQRARVLPPPGSARLRPLSAGPGGEAVTGVELA